jgi:ribonuclease BN (tRNA processing enzyme)
MTARLLGSGGWIPTRERATCSALLREGDEALVIDAGTGISHLVTWPDLLAGVSRLDIVLTHFHLDHVVGLAYLPALELAEPPRVHGPGAWLYATPTAEILARLLAPPLFLDLAAITSDVAEIGAGGLSLGRFDVRARVQERHAEPTLALRIGDELTYCTDTAYDEGNVEFARGSRILAHEAWWTRDAPRDRSTHSAAAQAARIARDAGVDELVMIHIHPGVDEDRLAYEGRSLFESSTVGCDLLRLG